MKPIYKVLLALIIPVNLFAQDNKILIQKANLFVNASARWDYKYYVEHSYPELVQKMGGKRKMLSQLSNIMQALRTNGTIIENATIGRPGKFYKAGTEIHCLVPEIINSINNRVLGGPAHYNFKINLLAISNDGGENWSFIAIDKIIADIIPDLLPNFNKDLKIRDIPSTNFFPLTPLQFSKLGSQQGHGVAISADGNTIMFSNGGPDSKMWIYKRINGSWVQNARLEDTLETTTGLRGSHIALRADGNTAVVAKFEEKMAWVYTCTGGVWSEGYMLANIVNYDPVNSEIEGIKPNIALSGDGNSVAFGGSGDWIYIFKREKGKWGKAIRLNGEGNSLFGWAISFSYDGNTVLVGGQKYKHDEGAAWAYTNKNGNWVQMGNRLTKTDSTFPYDLAMGMNLSLSADGKTALVASGFGGARIFKFMANKWVQQEDLRIGNDKTMIESVNLSADANTAIIGGDDTKIGAFRIFFQENNKWKQQGDKLIGADYVFIAPIGFIFQGCAVALSADGNTAIVGGYGDNGGIGAVWIFSRANGIWMQQGNKIVAKW